MPRRGRKKQLEALRWKLDRFLPPLLRCAALISGSSISCTKNCCALLFILRTIGITVFLHGRSHIYVVSVMGLPLGANGILTIPYINLASQNLIKRDAVGLLGKRTQCFFVPRLSLGVTWKEEAHCQTLLQCWFYNCNNFSVWVSTQNQQPLAVVQHYADFTMVQHVFTLGFPSKIFSSDISENGCSSNEWR